MNARNFWALPPVASASSAADASGVCSEGTTAVTTEPTSRARRRSSRSSLWLYSASESMQTPQ